ncbi:MAG: M48 family metalloprotease [Desulfobulbus sp.]|nr:M48 family metalloprotease [Desulfobulbus sp.]
MSKQVMYVTLCVLLLGIGAGVSNGAGFGDIGGGLGGKVNAGHVSAAKDLTSAASLSDAEVVNLSQQMRSQGDHESKVAPENNKYAQRLAKLTNKLRSEDGLHCNFKVYLTNDVNANATADGSIRVYSGLMDMMTDDELFYVVGHEIGHVKHNDSANALRVQYASSGLVKAANATAGASAGGLSTSQLSGLLHSVVNAQYSQSNEYDADAYGYQMMKKYNVNPQAAVSALMKIDKLGKSGGVLASHPNSAERAARIAKAIEKNAASLSN